MSVKHASAATTRSTRSIPANRAGPLLVPAQIITSPQTQLPYSIERLREKGHKITLLNETQFWRLVGKS